MSIGELFIRVRVDMYELDVDAEIEHIFSLIQILVPTMWCTDSSCDALIIKIFAPTAESIKLNKQWCI